MADTFEGKFIISRVIDNLNEDNWVLFVDLVESIIGVGRDANQIFHSRHSAEGFWHATGEVDSEGDPIFTWYGNFVMCAANFQKSAIKFERFKSKLGQLEDIDEENITYTTATNPQQYQRYRPSVVATFGYQGTSRARVALMGCASDANDDLCGKEESNEEALQVLAIDPVVWGEEVG